MKDRKKEHVDIVMEKNVSHSYNYWDDFLLVHDALPEIDLNEIDTSINIFRKKLKAPIIIAGMTGGFEQAGEINERLAKAAEKYGVAMGVGSQRAGLQDEKLEKTYSVVKNYDIPLRIANIGAPQLLEWDDVVETSQKAVDMISAHVLAIHLNFLQEVVQPEGDRNAKGCIKKIDEIASSISTPVIIKETGAGISSKTLEKVLDTGIAGIDVGGAGGTSFAAVESYRARMKKDKIREELGKIFWDWGIPTPYSLLEIAELCKDAGLTVIATGGIRHGMDVAKAIALGADAAGSASKMLKNPMEQMELFLLSLKSTMFLTGCKNIEELKEVEIWMK
ncbi:MAG: type 2 isopentenyl-diphosphate Delta-isomerase [Thermoplasmata archaeon]|nr:type 2 isopentenyl-diphosphate Delta-isomerase [Thermoplasmata archaeon]